MACTVEFVLCLRRGIVSDVMSSTKARNGPNFWKYAKTIPKTVKV